MNKHIIGLLVSASLIGCASNSTQRFPAAERSGGDVGSRPDAPVTLTIGKYVTISDEHSASLVSVSAKAFSSSETNTLAARGCHSFKQNTGEGFPYGVHYRPFEIQRKVEAKVTSQKQIEFVNMASTLRELKKELNKKMPFYCTSKEGVGVELEVKLDDSGKTAKSVLFIHEDAKGHYVDSVTGKLYLANDSVTLLPLPPGMPGHDD